MIKRSIAMTLNTPHLEKNDAFSFKSARIDLVSFRPITHNLTAIEALLEKKLGENSSLLQHEPLLVDLSQVRDTDLALTDLIKLMQRFQLNPVAIREGSLAHEESAKAQQLAILQSETTLSTSKPENPLKPALIIHRPIRSGQQIYAKGSDLIVLNLVSAGAEIIADGNIHVYAPLRGRALAGAKGNTEAKIFTTCLEAEILSIAGIYHTVDETLPDSLQGKAVQVFLAQKKLVIEALQC